MRDRRAARAATRWGWRAWLACLATGASALVGAPAALATSVYTITGGEVIVTASAGGVFLADPLELAVDGSFIEVDLSPGAEQIVALEVTTTGSDEVPLVPPVAGFDAIIVDALRITAGPGALFPQGPVPPDFEYSAVIEDFVLDVSFVLIDDTMPEPEEMIALPLGQGSGTLFVSLSGPDLSLTGVVERTFDIEGLGPVTIKADLNFSAVIPEPTAALVFAIGLLPIARATRRGRRTRS